MSHNSKYAISLLALLYIFSVGYSGFAIYKNNHSHDGSHYSLINLITGKGSKPSSLKNSTVVAQIAKQNSQYATPKAEVSPAKEDENSQRQQVADFYDQYLKNKNSSKSEDALIATFGTTNMHSQYRSGQKNNDPLLCGGQGVTTYNIGDRIDELNGYYIEFFSSAKAVVSSGQVSMSGSGGSSLIDGVGCLGPV